MKSALITLIILSFLGMAVFSFLAMAGENGHMNLGCIASAVQNNASCPENNPIGIINFHINAFKTFSLAVFKYLNFAFLIFLSFLIILFSGLIPGERQTFGFVSRILRTEPKFQNRFIRWLALFEKSPATL